MKQTKALLCQVGLIFGWGDERKEDEKLKLTISGDDKIWR